MLTDIKIGQFFPANSLLHKLDARLKIVSLFILIVGIFVFDSKYGSRRTGKDYIGYV